MAIDLQIILRRMSVGACLKKLTVTLVERKTVIVCVCDRSSDLTIANYTEGTTPEC